MTTVRDRDPIGVEEDENFRLHQCGAEVAGTPSAEPVMLLSGITLGENRLPFGDEGLDVLVRSVVCHHDGEPR
jgi:hypothetical protein